MLSLSRLGLGFKDQDPVVSDVTFTLGAGERLLICGSTGSGKTTLISAAAGIIPRLTPNPGYQGEVRLNGQLLEDFSRDALFSQIGVVTQNVEEQLWDLGTEDVIAFPLENRGIERAVVRDVVRDIMERLQLTALAGRRVLTLSGGERRMVAMAAAIATGSRLLVLDEPTTGLDPEARARLRRALDDLAANGTAVLLADQDAAALAGAVDRIALLSGGRLSDAHQPESLLNQTTPWLEAGLLAPRAPRRPRAEITPGEELLAICNLSTVLSRPDGQKILQDVDLALHAGEAVAVLGKNGAGKTTLFKSLLGLLPVASGEIHLGREVATGWTTARRARQIAYVPQNMRQILFNLTVVDELLFAMTATPGKSTPELRQKASELLVNYGLPGMEEANPFALSARQQGQLGLACAEATGAAIAIIDEPLLARDLKGRALLDNFINRMRAGSRAVMIITHDLELANDVAERMVIVGGGGIAFDGPMDQGWSSDAFRQLGWERPYGLGEAQ